MIFTPLDDKPLADSRQILITAMARDKQTGAEFNADWSKLVQVGGPPLLMEPVEAALLLAGSIPTSVTPLDGYGMATGATVPIESDGRFTIDGRYEAYYYEIKR